MTATLHDLLKSYREGGVFPSYDQLAAIAGQDQIGAAVRGEAVARLMYWCGPSHYVVPHGGVCARTYAEFGKGAGENGGYWKEGEELFTASSLSAHAAEAPYEPSEPLLTMAQVNAILDTIKPGDGWDGDDWDFALANAVATNVKSRAADALDSQPTVLAYVATDLDGRADVGMTPEKAMERAGHGCDTIIPVYDLGSSQPTDGGVRNG